jgi:hypothetical protein
MIELPEDSVDEYEKKMAELTWIEPNKEVSKPKKEEG